MGKTSPAETVYLALGSNLGDRLAFLLEAARALACAGLADLAVSAVYETDAVADEPQPPYLNAVLRGETSMAPLELLAAALRVEAGLGRRRPPGRAQAPRTVDVDILLHGTRVVSEEGLTVPHPRLLLRPFVRIPLADVARPGLAHPLTGERLDEAAPAASVRLFITASELSRLAFSVSCLASAESGRLTNAGGDPQAEVRMSGERQHPGSPYGERRKAARIPIEMWVEERTDNERYYRRAGNLSRGGLRLEHTIPLPVGTTVHLSFTLPGEEVALDVSGVIVSSAGPDSLGMGVKFVDVVPEAEARLEAYIARVGVSL